MSDNFDAIATTVKFPGQQDQVVDIGLEPMAVAVDPAGPMAPPIRGDEVTLPSQQRHQTQPGSTVEEPAMDEQRLGAGALLPVRKQGSIRGPCRVHNSSQHLGGHLHIQR